MDTLSAAGINRSRATAYVDAADVHLRTAMNQLNFHGFSEIPAVDADGKLAGMPAQIDVISACNKKVLQAKL